LPSSGGAALPEPIKTENTTKSARKHETAIMPFFIVLLLSNEMSSWIIALIKPFRNLKTTTISYERNYHDRDCWLL